MRNNKKKFFLLLFLLFIIGLAAYWKFFYKYKFSPRKITETIHPSVPPKMGKFDLGKFVISPKEIPDKEFTIEFTLGYLDESDSDNEKLLLRDKEKIGQIIINQINRLNDNFFQDDDHGQWFKDDIKKEINLAYPEFEKRGGLVLKIFTPVFLINEK